MSCYDINLQKQNEFGKSTWGNCTKEKDYISYSKC